MNYYELAATMLRSPGAPQFKTEREKVEAIADLAKKLQESDKGKKK